jgi:hypothetical protein
LKFKELFEMPTYQATVLPVSDFEINIISADALDRDYDLLGEIHDDNTLERTVGAIRKDKTLAIIGDVKTRRDGKTSLEISAEIKFHASPELGNASAHHDLPENSIQVDTVLTVAKNQSRGLAYKLYKMLLDRGYTVVSDNIQYIGGRKLWEKILRQSAMDHHNVFILQNGKYLRDANGAPLVYDGVNISADDIWSTDKRSEPHYYTLLVAKNT